MQYATEQLFWETGRPTLASVQARLIQCFFLVARGRMNRTYRIFSETVNLIYKLKFHKRNPLYGEYSMIDVECEKRVYWAAFSLDKFLNYSLNRPQYLRHDDADQVRFTLIYCLNSSLHEISDSIPLSIHWSYFVGMAHVGVGHQESRPEHFHRFMSRKLLLFHFLFRSILLIHSPTRTSPGML
jgi:hypothetical protein